MANHNRQRGFTLVEVSIVVLALSALSSIMLVNLGGYTRLARYARVAEDLGALCSALGTFIVDTGETAFSPRRARQQRDELPASDSAPVGLLIGDGNAPLLSRPDLRVAGRHWRASHGDSITERNDISGHAVRFVVDSFANHLIHNTPADDPAAGYRTPLDMPEGFNSLFAWRGPYISDRIDADPWGNRYMANVFGLHIAAKLATDGFGSAVVCYSAGPDGEIDTAFNQPGGWATGDDDFTAVAGGGGR